MRSGISFLFWNRPHMFWQCNLITGALSCALIFTTCQMELLQKRIRLQRIGYDKPHFSLIKNNLQPPIIRPRQKYNLVAFQPTKKDTYIDSIENLRLIKKAGKARSIKLIIKSIQMHSQLYSGKYSRGAIMIKMMQSKLLKSHSERIKTNSLS